MSYPFFEQHLRMLLLPLAYSLTNTNHQFLGYHMAEKWTLPNFDLASSQPILPTTITAFNPLFHFDSCDPKTRTIINSSTNGVSELSSLHSTTNSIIFDGSIRHKSVPFKWRRLTDDRVKTYEHSDLRHHACHRVSSCQTCDYPTISIAISRLIPSTIHLCSSLLTAIEHWQYHINDKLSSISLWMTSSSYEMRTLHSNLKSRSITSRIGSSDLNDDGRIYMSDTFDPVHSVEIKSLVYDLSQSIDLFHDMNKATYTMVLLNDLYKSNMNTRRFRSNDLNDVDRIFMSDTFDPVHVYDLSHNIDLPYDMTNTYQQPLLYLEDGNPGNTMLLYCSFVWFIQICYLKIYFYKLNVIISLYRLLKKKKKKRSEE
eukprot:921019_1